MEPTNSTGRPPRVSIYMATQNRANLLPRAIDSVLHQTLQDFELLVVDDASTDTTPRILSEIARRDPRVQVFRREVSSGSGAARNLAIRHASGEFIIGLDDDDAMLPNRLETHVAAYSDEHAFVCSPYFRDYGCFIQPGPIGREQVTLDDLLFADVVGIQVLTSTARMREIGMFDETMDAWVDYDLFTRLVTRYGPGLRIPVRTAIVNVDPRARRVTTSKRALQGAHAYYEKYSSLMNHTQRRNQRLMQTLVRNQGLTLSEAWSNWGPGTRTRVVRAWMAFNVPLAMRLREAWWKWRWSAGGSSAVDPRWLTRND